MPEQNVIDIDIDEIESNSSQSKKAALKESAIDQLVADLGARFRRYASARSNKETEWVNAIRQYQGLLEPVLEKKLRALGYGDDRSQPPAVNLTRQKTNISVARLQDLQFPTGGDYNFTIDPTESPEIESSVNSEEVLNEQGETIGGLAQGILQEARERARGMEVKIRDIMTEANYGRKAREAIQDLGILGTAIIKGPTLQRKLRRTYKSMPTESGDPVRLLRFESRITPDIQRVDPRLFYPDPNARPGMPMEDAFEVHLMTRRELIRLARNSSFSSDRIKKLLENDPDGTEITDSIQNLSLIQTGQSIDNRYVVKEYHGPISKEVLVALGELDEEDEENTLISREGEVWFCQGQLIRVSLSHIEGDDDLPYAAAVWEADESSFFGHGVPYLMRDAQHVVNASWLMLLENAGLTSGPQVIINKEMIEPAVPAEGWSISPMKVWFATEYGANVREAIQFVDIPANMESISSITEMAMQFADIESSTPLMQQGEMPSGQNTTSGIAMVMSASNVVQKRTSRDWDDNVNTKIASRLYHFVMQYDEDDSIKGDFEVKAGGATDHIDAQLRAQDIERVLGMAQSNEEFMEQVDTNAAFRQWVQTTRSGNILLSPEQVEANRRKAQEEAQNQPPPPEVMQAQARLIAAQADAKRVELDAQIKQMELQIKQQESAAKLELLAIEASLKQEENQVSLQRAQLDRELALIKIAADSEKTVAQIEKDLEITRISEETKRLIKAVDMEQFREELRHAEETGKGI